MENFLTANDTTAGNRWTLPRHWWKRLACVATALTLSACSSPAPSSAAEPAQGSAKPAPASADAATGTTGRAKATQRGIASFMSDRLHGEKTASGEPYDKNKLVAAHATYAMGTVVRVTNLENGRTVDVTIVDRGPKAAGNRIIDISRAAAERLDFIGDGTVQVRIELIEWGPKDAK